MFPVDTVKTHMQAKAGPQSGLGASAPTTLPCCSFFCLLDIPLARTHTHTHAHARAALTRTLAAEAGYGRLWRGVTPMFVACVPAHAGTTIACIVCVVLSRKFDRDSVLFLI